MTAHWGTFTKQASLREALSMAQDALRSYGYQIWDTAQNGDYLVIGGNAQVVLTIVCVPQAGNVWMVVNACSADSATAESARNRVREKIVRWHRIDPNP
jgi:hypothetical protein